MNKKNIVIVTWIESANYGTALQSYALYKKIKEMGHEASCLREFDQNFSYKSFLKIILYKIGCFEFLIRFVKFGITNKRRRFYMFYRDDYQIMNVFTKSDFEKMMSSTDVFMTGSDQIWNTLFRFNPFYFLSFARDCKRIAYASSVGSERINDTFTDDIREYLLAFDHIGVREKTAVTILSELTGRKDILQVLDPTFLLTSVDWEEVTENASFTQSLPKHYMLCYLIGNNTNYKDYVRDIKYKMGIDNIIIVPSDENPDFFCEDCLIYRDAGPLEFVWLIQHANLVCTDSFHASALSINHSIPFVELMRFRKEDNNSQNSRIYDLLEHYNLKNRIYDTTSECWMEPIDFNVVQEILNIDRNHSIDFLINAIEN